MTISLLFGFPEDLQVEDLLLEKEVFTLFLTSSQTTQACPDCAYVSSRVHSRYLRGLADLPWQGRAVGLCLTVRRVFCQNPACLRKTFAEQFPQLAPASVRRTLRQGKTLGEIAFALGGRAGARRARLLGLPVSFWTLLRLIRRTRHSYWASMTSVRHEKVACVAVRTHERRLLPGVLPSSALPG